MTDAPFVKVGVRKRSFDIVLSYIGAPFEGPFEDWPQQAQETVLEALERKGAQVGRTLTIDRAGSDVDHDNDGYAFIHVVAVCYEGLN